MPDSLEDLDQLLVMVAKPRMVRRDGIHFQGLCFMSSTLALYVGENVTVRYDPRMTRAISARSGCSKRTASCVGPYPQLYSRIGFVHHYRPLKGEELTFVLTRHWRKLGLHLDDADFTDHQAVASIARMTGGNFRLLHRLFVQIERILKINELSLVTDHVVEAARSTLVIGAT